MSYVLLPGRGAEWLYPALYRMAAPPTFGANTFAATGDKVAWVGRVFWSDPTVTSRDISRVQFRFGSVTKAGGSALTVSLQDVLTSSGTLAVPDETQDQTVAIANADGSFVSNTWYRTGTLSANRTVNLGDLLSVVIEYDGSGRLGSDSVAISNLASTGNSGNDGRSCVVIKTSGTWALANSVVNLVLEANDGTICTLGNGLAVSAINSHAINSGTASADEYALPFSFPFGAKIESVFVPFAAAGGTSDFEIILYTGTTATRTLTVDGNTIISTSGRMYEFVLPTEFECLANTTYYLAVRPTTANNVTVYSLDVNSSGHLDIYPGGANCNYITRVDQGAWASPTTTRRFLAGVRISSIDIPSGGGSVAIPVSGRICA